MSQTVPGDPSVRSRQVLEMLTIANDFCQFIEKEATYSREQLLVYLHRILPLIYLKASLLPESEVTDEDAVEHYVTEEEWETVFNKVRSFLGEDDLYYYIDLHEKTQQEPIRASIAENMADLFQDLKDFVMLYQKPLLSFQENAVKECRRLFEIRYGYRLVNCHVAIHYLLFKESMNEDYSMLENIF